MGTEYNDNSILEMFGLSYEQSLLMFSAEKLIARYDYMNAKKEKKAYIKAQWISEWEAGITNYLNKIDGNNTAKLLDRDELQRRFKKEIDRSNNKTWYYIIALELLEYVPYTPLGTRKDEQYAKCKFDEKELFEYVKQMLLEHGYMSEHTIDRLEETYEKSIRKISGKTGKLAAKVLAVIALAAVGAAAASIAAPGIAIALVGGAFEGLNGIALANACLALIGGGAIAAGGAGMAGGVAVIAGGGALLGLAGGGAAVGAIELFASSPDYTLTQAAKLETILKEVILNSQQDVVSAQKILAKYKEQIEELNKRLVSMEISDKKNKSALKNIKKSLEYLMRSFKEMDVFTSSYDTGLRTID